MNIGILGAGRMGTMLARLFIGVGHAVRLANSRGPGSLATTVAALGPLATAGTRDDVAEFGPVVILAVGWVRVPDAVANLPALAGRIVVDTTNNRTGPRPEDLVDLAGRTSSEVVADLVPGSSVVKAFNHQPIAALDTLRGSPQAERKALFLAGDDPSAKSVVASMIRELGGEPIDTGTLREGGRLQGTGNPLAGHGRLLPCWEARALLEQLRTGHGEIS
jgi:predicted dinucleotide-binding enzyme